MICARDAVARTLAGLRDQIGRLSHLIDEHRSSPMVARTLTQHAIPTTFGLKAAGWLTGVLDAYDDLAALALPVQVGGAAGSMAGAVELASGLPDPVDVVHRMMRDLADALGLAQSPPWHTSRATVTRLGDASVRCTDAWGRIANDVLTLSRPEIGELSEDTGGGSSTMPNKANPVLSALVHRAALTTPQQLAATLHLASAESVDERSAGPWHAEWATLRTLLRRTVVAGEQTGELLSGLQVHADRMQQTLTAAEGGVRAEQRNLAGLTGGRPATTTPAPARRSRMLRWHGRRRHPRPTRRRPHAPTREDPMTPGITAVRMTGAKRRDELPLLVLGPSLGTSASTLGRSARAASPTSSTWSPGTCPGTATTARYPTSRSRWPSSPRACSRSSTTCCSSAASTAARSSTRATPSAARSACSCSSTGPAASPRRRCSAPARRSATRRCGPAGSAR